MTREDDLGHSDIEAALATRRELGARYDAELVEGFAERIERAVDRRVADQVFMPLAVGGGIRTVEDMRALLMAGADKVSVNTSAVQNPTLLTEGAERFGSQCIVLAVDARRVPAQPARARAKIDQKIRAADDVHIVLDDQHRVAQVAQSAQHGQHALVIARVQANGRLV